MSDEPERYFDESELRDDVPHRCIYCHGTGNNGEGSSYYPCPDCNGSGYIEEIEDNEET